MSKIFVPDSGEKSKMAADLKRGRGSPRHGREDEDGVDSRAGPQTPKCQKCYGTNFFHCVYT